MIQWGQKNLKWVNFPFFLTHSPLLLPIPSAFLPILGEGWLPLCTCPPPPGPWIRPMICFLRMICILYGTSLFKDIMLQRWNHIQYVKKFCPFYMAIYFKWASLHGQTVYEHVCAISIQKFQDNKDGPYINYVSKIFYFFLI